MQTLEGVVQVGVKTLSQRFFGVVPRGRMLRKLNPQKRFGVEGAGPEITPVNQSSTPVNHCTQMDDLSKR